MNSHSQTFPVKNDKKLNFSKMRILVLSFAFFAKGINLTARDFAIFDEKLRGYQNMTGIDEATFNEIWESGIANGKLFFRTTFHTFLSSKLLVPDRKQSTRLCNQTWIISVNHGTVWAIHGPYNTSKPGYFRPSLLQLGYAIQQRNLHHRLSRILQNRHQVLLLRG